MLFFFFYQKAMMKRKTQFHDRNKPQSEYKRGNCIFVLLGDKVFTTTNCFQHNRHSSYNIGSQVKQFRNHLHNPHAFFSRVLYSRFVAVYLGKGNQYVWIKYTPLWTWARIKGSLSNVFAIVHAISRVNSGWVTRWRSSATRKNDNKSMNIRVGRESTLSSPQAFERNGIGARNSYHEAQG